MSTVDALHTALIDAQREIQEVSAQLEEIPLTDISERNRVEGLVVQSLNKAEAVNRLYTEARLKHMATLKK